MLALRDVGDEWIRKDSQVGLKGRVSDALKQERARIFTLSLVRLAVDTGGSCLVCV
ncbi:uncharacterized protein FOMMEDRAFT_152848 [Fomitiporia mediterranea MF3/22]|uniref:uncharacterized protein n=1 Tax=Fomitiporia mediterranea (strain MF3/22) TaxID=694068 RepID=UPI00044080FF|nr:uncharacterized protein FOMMEDRAFT_152848 [Fomitiporia mediterranea MF3/22]EJD05525.1 hypothetical protein FOMMEDRAFT_152848 [Fomitiporia mediterranea MF3/22]